MQTIIGSQFPKIVIPKINETKNTIDIIIFDWRWYFNDAGSAVQLFNQSVVRAVRRGVRVRAITNNSQITQTLKKVGIEAKTPATKNIIHSKLMLLDSKIIVIGSHNYTQPAFTANHELSVMFEDEKLAQEYKDFFNSLWQL